MFFYHTYLCEQIVFTTNDNDDSSSWVEPSIHLFDGGHPVRYEVDAVDNKGYVYRYDRTRPSLVRTINQAYLQTYNEIAE